MVNILFHDHVVNVVVVYWSGLAIVLYFVRLNKEEMAEDDVLEMLFSDEVEFADSIPLKPTGPAVSILQS